MNKLFVCVTAILLIHGAVVGGKKSLVSHDPDAVAATRSLVV